MTGIVETACLKQNNTAEPGCEIFLTKPLGVGILSTAQKMGKIEPGHIEPSIEAMCTLNKIGAEIARLDGVVALTDVTGFGLLGHLGEICDGSGISATIQFDRVKKLPNIGNYLAMGCIPGGSKNNFKSYGHTVGALTDEQRGILCDPQTSGGLLCVVRPDGLDAFLELTAAAGLNLESIGQTREQGDKLIEVI